MDSILSAGNIITIATLALSGAIAFGKIDQRVKNIEERHTGCDKKFQKIEENHTNAINDIREEIMKINNTLHELVGMFKMFMGNKEQL